MAQLYRLSAWTTRPATIKAHIQSAAVSMWNSHLMATSQSQNLKVAISRDFFFCAPSQMLLCWWYDHWPSSRLNGSRCWPIVLIPLRVGCNRQQGTLVLGARLASKPALISNIMRLTINYSVQHQVNKAVCASTATSITAKHTKWDRNYHTQWQETNMYVRN